MIEPLPELGQEVCPYCRQPVAIYDQAIPHGRPRYHCHRHGDVRPIRRVALLATGAWEVRDSD